MHASIADGRQRMARGVDALPDELLCETILWLPNDLLAAGCVCSRLRRILLGSNVALWKRLHKQRWSQRYDSLPLEASGAYRNFYLARARLVAPTVEHPPISFGPQIWSELYLIVEANSKAKLTGEPLVPAEVEKLATVLPFKHASRSDQYPWHGGDEHQFEWDTDLTAMVKPTYTLASQHPQRMGPNDEKVECHSSLTFMALWHAPSQRMCILVREGERVTGDVDIRHDGIIFNWWTVHMCSHNEHQEFVRWNGRTSREFWRTADARLRQFMRELRGPFAPDHDELEPPIRWDVSFNTNTEFHSEQTAVLADAKQGRIRLDIVSEFGGSPLADDRVPFSPDEFMRMLSLLPWE